MLWERGGGSVEGVVGGTVVSAKISLGNMVKSMHSILQCLIMDDMTRMK